MAAQRGTEVEVAFSGDAWPTPSRSCSTSRASPSASLKPTARHAVKTKLAIAPDCRLGLHQLRIRTASGISNLRTFSVGACRRSTKPSRTTTSPQPQKIALDITVNGVVENEDVDYFAVEAKKGERITAEIEGLRLGNTFFDPYVAILDTKRFELARSDDAPLVRQDCVCSIVAPEDGTYIIQVRETSFAGNGACMYRLHVGRFPRPTAVLPLGGKPGETLDVQWLGDVLGPRAEKVTLPADVCRCWPRLFGLFAKDDAASRPRPILSRRAI